MTARNSRDPGRVNSATRCERKSGPFWAFHLAATARALRGAKDAGRACIITNHYRAVGVRNGARRAIVNHRDKNERIAAKETNSPGEAHRP